MCDNTQKYLQLKNDTATLIKSFSKKLLFTMGKDAYTANHSDEYLAFAYTVRDRMIANWIKTKKQYYDADVKRVYYLSLEFLLGRTLGNSLVNLGIYSNAASALQKYGLDLEELRETEWDAGLGNGGLGRLAACFLDSLASLSIPAIGYGIRYEYGIFQQRIVDGFQVETPDNWLRYGNPWEIERPQCLYPIRFYGEVDQYYTPSGKLMTVWKNTDDVMAMAYDTLIPGYLNNTVNTLRLWSAKSSRDFNLAYFNSGDYVGAVEQKTNSEIISKVLYPNDNTFEGKELRLKQEYFFVAATIADISRRFEKKHHDWSLFPSKAAIQLNDTHPALAIAELMRLLVDEKNLPWDFAWNISTQVFAYTNHTILPEALEKWDINLLGRVLPRHLQIIYEINRRFMSEISARYPEDFTRQARMSIILESHPKMLQTAKLAIIGSHSVNGVSRLHSEIIKEDIFKDFYEYTPAKFNNKTNGITPRRWLLLANPSLSTLITEKIGDAWVRDLSELKKLRPLINNPAFVKKWQQMKYYNKGKFVSYLASKFDLHVNIDSLFDFQVKRIHEYKRQLLNVLHACYLYNKLRDGQSIVPRTIFIAGKAAPGYHTAKLIIKLISSVAHHINNDPEVNKQLALHFLPNYCVSMAQNIFPAAELSQQISLAGTEASGTGNMKCALTGALTIGTLDGANVEMAEEVGDDTIFIFGLKSAEVNVLKNQNYQAMDYINADVCLKRIIEMIHNGSFSPENRELFRPLTNALMSHDNYCLCADFAAYIKAQEQVERVYQDTPKWNKMSIANVAGMGKFSSDRTISEYARDIWYVQPLHIE